MKSRKKKNRECFVNLFLSFISSFSYFFYFWMITDILLSVKLGDCEIYRSERNHLLIYR